MRWGAVFAILLGAVGPASAGTLAIPGNLEIRGNLLVEYRDGEFQEGLNSNSAFRVPQGAISLHYRFSDWTEAYTRGSYSDVSGVTLQEAWISQSGIGPGRVTLGRFFRPRGAPIPTLNVSIPSRVFRSAPVIGIKYGVDLEDNDVHLEFGVTNRNRLSLSGSTLGDTFVTARVNTATSVSGPSEIYGHLKTGAGGDWGTVEVGLTGIYSRLQTGDEDTLRNAGFFFVNTGDRHRRIGEASIDYIYGPVRLFGDAVWAHEGDLRHEAWEAGATYRFLRDFRLSGSYGQYRVNADIVAFNRPWTWNRNIKRAGLIWEARPGVQVQSEYEWNSENALRPGGTKIDNDMVAVQVVTSF